MLNITLSDVLVYYQFYTNVNSCIKSYKDSGLLSWVHR